MARQAAIDTRAAEPVEESGTGLRRARLPPLVPVDSAASRSLVGVIALLTFLAALCAGAAELVATSSSAWRGDVAREATIQLRPTPQRDIEADVARAVDLAGRTPGIAEARAFTRSESEEMLEPWLGRGLDFGDLPMPRLIVLRLKPGERPDFSALRTQLARLPGATLDDHGQWLSRLSTMANTIVGIAVGLVALVLLATGLAVAFATRGAMASNREVVDVLHFVGANDRFIAREFRTRFLRLGLRGGLIGSLSALALFVIAGFFVGGPQTGPAGAQIEAMFGTFAMGWRGDLVILAVAFIVSGITGLVSGITVRRFLRETI